MRYLWYICLCLCFLCNGVFAKESAYSATEVNLYTQSQTVIPGQPLWSLIKITPKDGWHIYWNNPGDTGLPTKAELSSDFGTAILKRQSAPKHFLIQNLITQYAYDDAAYWLFELSVPKQNPNNLSELTLTADASWLACKDECIGENLTLTQKIPLDTEAQPNSGWAKEFKAAEKTFPHKYLKGYFKAENNQLTVEIPKFNRPISELKFVPFIRDMVQHQKPVIFSVQSDGHLWLKVSLQEEVVLPSALKALAITDSGVWQFRLSEKDITYPLTANYPFGTILLMAFLGGLILNLMPCIFPILFIKVLQLLHSTENQRQRYWDAAMYFVGVILSFILIAGLLWALRSGGEAIGWGFQLQSPVFIGLLFILFFIIGLLFLGVIQFNFSGFNRLGTLSAQNAKLNAFLTGLVAVLIASPCSAPFMGAAIGYSITQPLYIYFPVFLALGIGYALPFCLLTLFPQTLGKLLPRPGKWMDILKKIFAVPIFLTCLWLGWIFYNQTIGQTTEVVSSELNWQSFSEQKLQDLQMQHKPVFVDFTAKWCLTCLVNEKTALSSHTFKKIIREKEITLLKADWTNRDEEITQALAVYNRNSVPLYVYYDGKSNEPHILPQLLTAKKLKERLR